MNNNQSISTTRKFRRFFITTLLGGFIVILPLGILIFLFKWVFNIVSDILQPLTELMGAHTGEYNLFLQFISFVVLVTICFLFGLLIRTNAGAAIFEFIEDVLLEKVPLYNSIKEVVSQFLGDKRGAFKKVGLVDVFGNDTRLTGFVMDEYGDRLTVYVPTSPNPASGNVYHIKRSQFEVCDISVDECMRIMVGCGSGSKVFFNNLNKNKIEN